MKQLLTYFGLTYLISWLIWLPLYGYVFGWTNLTTVPYQHALGGLGPLIASVLTTWIFLKKEGVKNLLKKCFQFKPIVYLMIALLSPFVLLLVALIICFFVDKTPVHLSGLLTSKEFPQFHWLTFFIYNLVFFGLGEETGWRGFALPRLQAKMNALSASIVLTAFWALWHLPLFYYRPGYTTMNSVAVIGWVLSLLTGSILLTWLYNSTRGSILICAVFHSTIDIAFTADVANENIANYMGFLITALGILLVVMLKPKTLSRHKKEIFPDLPQHK